MEYDLVSDILRCSWMATLFVDALPVVLPDDTEDLLDDVVVLLIWCSVIGPCQILQLRYYSGLTCFTF